MELFYPVAGFIVGLVVGVTGVGGGSLMTPILIIVFNVPAAVGVGTDLLFACITKTFGVAAHGEKENVDWKIFCWMALGSIPSAAIALATLATLKDRGDLNRFIMPLLGLALVGTAAAIIFQQFFPKTRPSSQASVAAQKRMTILLGAGIGVLVTITSVGAGAVGLAVLRIIYPRMRSARAVGTDIMHAIPLTMIAGFGHIQLGTVSYGLLFALLTGSVPGIWIGSVLGSKLPEKAMQRALACVLVTVGLACLL